MDQRPFAGTECAQLERDFRDGLAKASNQRKNVQGNALRLPSQIVTASIAPMPETFTLLLTDVVDSTQLNSRLGDTAMSPLWAAHDQQSRTLMQLWSAREIARSDGFLLLFQNVENALGFAHDYGRALRRLPVPLQARVGIHTGPVELRHNNPVDVGRGAPLVEIDGIALPLAARLMAAASGGQILLSYDSWRALAARLQGDSLTVEDKQTQLGSKQSPETRSSLPARMKVMSQGHWRFKGIDLPVEVFQAGTELDDFAPPSDSTKAHRVVREGAGWRPLGEVPGNLPAELDLFVGRSSDLRAIENRFEQGAKLLSLLGIGGIGKTRLALHYARAWRGNFPGGSWFCDLSSARGLQGVIHAVSQAFEVAIDKTVSVRRIGSAIAGRGDCLVILDNFEQVTRHAEETLGQWLRHAPQARFLVTSREQLGIAGENAVLVDPLLPSEAENLLQERMASAGADMPLGTQDLAAIRPLVELLDRMPLAIELAASRTRVMRPTEVLSRMGQRFKLLRTRTGRQDRQATLQATLDWSWDLLSAIERAAMAQSSIFEGGFTLAAAERVFDLTRYDTGSWVADVVQALVEKSLLRRGASGRFLLLRSVHAYAAQRLADLGEVERAEAERRHWEYFGSLDERAAIANRCAEAENLVIACRRATASGQVEDACAALVAAWSALNLTGPFKVAIEMAEELFRRAHPDSTEVAMTARWVAGSARFLAGEILTARDDLEVAASADGSPSLKARALCGLGQVERSLGHLERANEVLQAGLRAAQTTGDSGLICRAYNSLGVLRLAQSELSASHHYLSVGLEAARAAQDLKQQASLLGNLGVIESRQGRDDTAFQRYEEALNLAQSIGDRRLEGNMRSNLGLVHQQFGRAEDALVELQAALFIAQGAGLTRLSAHAACNLGLVKESLGRKEEALVHHSEAVRLADSLSDGQLAGHFRIYAGRVLLRQERCEEARKLLDAADLLLDQCPDLEVLGLLACANAEWADYQGDEEELHRWINFARRRLLESGASPQSELSRELSRLDDQLSL